MKTSIRLVLPSCLVAFVLFTGCGGSSSNSGGTPTNPSSSPTVSSISPATVTAGAESLTLTVTGTNFLSTTTVQVGGVADVTSYVSATQVKATVTAQQLITGSELAVIALNGSASSGSGTAINLEVTNPVPAISQLAPAALSAGTAFPEVIVTGTGFVPTTVIDVNGSARATAFVSATQVNVTLTATDVAAASTLSLTAVNVAPGGGTSPAATIAINNPAPGPRLTLSPAVVTAGATASTTVTVTGTNFIPASTIQLNGQSRATIYVSSTQLTFLLTVNDEATSQLISVSVVNPAPGGGSSLPAQLEILPQTPTPVITQVSPSQFAVGSGPATIQVSGSNLVTQLNSGLILLTSTVLWNGTALTTQAFFSGPEGTYLQATVPESLLTSTGIATITVSSSNSIPPISNALTVTIGNPPTPTLTSLSPNSGPINTTTTVTLSGTGFTASSTAALNGTNIPTTYVNSNELTVAIPASSVTLPGNLGFTVTTPAPGGGTTAPLSYTAYIGIPNNSMVYNPVNGLFYVSVPSSAGAPYGNSVVSVDPETGALGIPIPVGSEPNKLAITSDGKYLWVGLDAASAVRQVDLTTGKAGMQFSLGTNGGVYQTPPTALALAALPGSPNSVVVATEVFNVYEGTVGIYDSGVLRGSSANSSINGVFYSLLVDGTRNEIYAGGSTYDTFTYSSTGLTPLATVSSGSTYASASSDEMQIAGGKLYSDFGQVFDPESGSLLGTFYLTGTTPATGPTVADTTLGKAFVLDDSQAGNYGSYTQIQTFDISNYTSGAASISVGVPALTGYNSSAFPSRLTRWGTNGLAFRNAVGVFSLKSNLVKDLSSVSADLDVNLASAGTNITGSNTTYTATVSDLGPSASTNVALTVQLPSSGVLVSVTPSSGACSTSNGVTCDLGGIANGSSATVTFVVKQTTAGSSAMTLEVTGAETDPNTANNQATSTVTVTGGVYNLPSALTAITPSAILSGSSDTLITVTGSGFSSASTILLGGAPLATSFSSSTQLTATVPQASLATLGWQPITVSNPAPGGGVSGTLPLSVYSVITLGVNHILYDPYSRKIMASVGSGSSTVTGNSIVAITPETASVGTPVPIGSQPTNLALTSDGQILYTILTGSQSVARFNMLTQTADYTYAVPNNSSFDGGIALRGIATQPGTENTVALDLASFTGNAIYDFDPANKTAAIRGQASGPYSGSCIAFLDAGDMLAFDTDTSGATLDHYTVTSAGFTYYDYQQYSQSTLNGFGCFKLSGGLAYGNAGGVANPATVPATQLGVFPVTGGGGYSTTATLAPDTSLQSAFFLVDTQAGATTGYNPAVDGFQAFNQNTFLPSSSVSLSMETIEGNTSYTGVDLIRWGQDGLAALTSGGHIYLLRGAFVVPQLLNHNSVATLTSSSMTAIAHGTGNTLLTLTGANFVPGVAVTWNGSYRTTTIIDATHVTVAIPASDLASSGGGSLVATNPGATASSALQVTVN
jgi:trimeric autotransporter adhesin